MAISSIGVGSGLPIEQLLKDLRASENQPLVQIQSQQVSAQNRFTAYGTLKSTIEALNKAAQELNKPEAFGALKASTSSEAFTASASTNAIAGQYNIQVTQLATAQSMAFQGQADRTTNIGEGGVISVTIGEETHTIDMTGKGTSLDDLVSAINDDAELGFTATLINDGGDNPRRLLFTAKATGEEAVITNISVSGNEALSGLINFNSEEANAHVDVQVAKNAILNINGIDIKSQSNTVEDAIEGVTLSLTKLDTEGSNLSISRDDAVTSKAINAFVTAYNTLQTTIKSLTAYDVDNQKSSALTGDSLARSAQSQVRQALNAAESTGSIHTLSQLGITTSFSSGLLEVDDEKLAEALKTNMGDVQKLFAGEAGISSKLANVADAFTRSNGLISAAQDGADRSIKALAKQFEVTTARIDTKMEAYRQQFANLDVMMSQMNGVSSYLTQQLSMLGNMSKDS